MASRVGSPNLACRLPLLLSAAVSGCGEGEATKGGDVLVLAAASTRDALTEVAAAFEGRTGSRVTIGAGASNALATQILNGAPGDVFLSANRQWADAVREGGSAVESRDLLTNELVLVAPKGNPAGVMKPEDLLKEGVAKVALAGESVPAGQYAAESLRAAGVFERLDAEGRIARGQDVRVALSYVERGEAEAGVVYATDARLTDEVEVVHAFPADSHGEVVYPAVLLKAGESSAAAREFFEYLFSPEAEAIFRKHGFTRVRDPDSGGDGASAAP